VVVLAYVPTNQQCMRVPLPPSSLATFVDGGVLDDGHSNRGEVES
jgi:hypothetical protein